MHGASAGRTPTKRAAAVPRIDINSADRATLMTLPGIGKAEAEKIISHRPYLVSTEIVTKAGLPAGIYVAVKRQIVAVQQSTNRAAPRANAAR